MADTWAKLWGNLPQKAKVRREVEDHGGDAPYLWTVCILLAKASQAKGRIEVEPGMPMRESEIRTASALQDTAFRRALAVLLRWGASSPGKWLRRDPDGCFVVANLEGRQETPKAAMMRKLRESRKGKGSGNGSGNSYREAEAEAEARDQKADPIPPDPPSPATGGTGGVPKPTNGDGQPIDLFGKPEPIPAKEPPPKKKRDKPPSYYANLARKQAETQWTRIMRFLPSFGDETWEAFVACLPEPAVDQLASIDPNLWTALIEIRDADADRRARMRRDFVFGYAATADVGQEAAHG